MRKVFYIDPNNMVPNINYPLLESLSKRNKIEIRYFSGLTSSITDYYDKNYSLNTNYVFFNFIHKLKNGFVRKLFKSVLYPISCLIILIKAIYHKPEIIHYNWFGIVFYDLTTIFILKKILRKKIILTQHNYLQHEKNKLRFGENRIFQLADKIICLSQFIANSLPVNLSKKISIIEHGNCYETEIKNFKIVNESKKYDLVFVGNIRKYKGVEILIEAIEILINNDSKTLRAIIVGKITNRYFQSLSNLIEKKSLQKNIFLKNEILSYTKMFQIISNSKVGVLPYKKATQSGLPYIFYSLNVPIVMSNVGGLPEQAEKGISLLSEPNAKSMAKAIETMLEDVKNDTINANSFSKFQKYPWEKTIKKYEKLYNTI